MATCTIVVTYTPGTADKEAIVTGFTVDGTAYGSLSDAQKNQAVILGHQLQYALISTGKEHGKGRGGRDITS